MQLIVREVRTFTRVGIHGRAEFAGRHSSRIQGFLRVHGTPAVTPWPDLMNANGSSLPPVVK